jgi:hypothetical protein
MSTKAYNKMLLTRKKNPLLLEARDFCIQQDNIEKDHICRH